MSKPTKEELRRLYVDEQLSTMAIGVPRRLPVPRSPHPRRRGVRFEDRTVAEDFLGRPVTRRVLILDCGHQSPLRKYALRKEPTDIEVPCRACGAQEEKDHG